ncbi:GNAT family N-acetyltransferase [Mycobacterium mantenii]|uniref:Acetyltransferase n=1 Tax=Mycobacterium mantenii TaxID=560555 RepID=A0A1A2ST46_MYCNT|nr:GNAT family N-acetyltransferase [Mycobacterium mantenii]OBH41741.1 acetyltransferase [Mycobacterium mantenii]OBH59590.1 acetyltransferase [Mycobacterium mantenii]OBH66993.1 acetyltransferase [Mycobacterium mantenii]OBH67270.1 acetyltransferase [Mycobacterium mantenii]
MEPLTATLHIAPADSGDAPELAAVAAQTFPLACPASATEENIAAFVEANLSATRFAEYLGDPGRAIVTARQDGRIVGYAMLVRGVSDHDGVQQAVQTRPAAELSKMYVLPDRHSTGAAAGLMERILAVAADWGVRCVWLGVNRENQRAQRFYLKSGFTVSGTRTFQLGADVESDYVMIRELG